MVGITIIRINVDEWYESGLTKHFENKIVFNVQISKQAHPAETMG